MSDRPDTLAATTHRLIDASQRILDHLTAHHPEAFRSVPREDIDAYFDAARAARRAVATAPLQATMTPRALRHEVGLALKAARAFLAATDKMHAAQHEYVPHTQIRLDAEHAFPVARANAITAIDRAQAALNTAVNDDIARTVATDTAPAWIALPRPDGLVFAHPAPQSVDMRGHAPDPVEAEHGIDPTTRDGYGVRTVSFPPPPAPSPMKVAAVFPDPQSVDVAVTIHPDGVTTEFVRVRREHALPLIGGALVLAKDLVKRQHPRNAARYRDAALALTEALSLPPLADDPKEES